MELLECAVKRSSPKSSRSLRLFISASGTTVGDIHVSDRRVTVGVQLYLPRLVGIGEPCPDVLISQNIKGAPSDNVPLTGNGDRVMTQLANDTDLRYAEVDLCLCLAVGISSFQESDERSGKELELIQ